MTYSNSPKLWAQFVYAHPALEGKIVSPKKQDKGFHFVKPRSTIAIVNEYRIRDALRAAIDLVCKKEKCARAPQLHVDEIVYTNYFLQKFEQDAIQAIMPVKRTRAERTLRRNASRKTAVKEEEITATIVEEEARVIREHTRESSPTLKEAWSHAIDASLPSLQALESGLKLQADSWIFPRPRESVFAPVARTMNEYADWILPENARLDRSLMFNFFRIEESTDTIIKLVEDTLILLHMIINARNRADRYMALLTFSKLRGSCPTMVTVLATVAYEVFGLYSDRQADIAKEKVTLQSAEGFIKSARKCLDNYDTMRDSPTAKKLYKFALYALSFSLFSKLGITFDTFRYSKIEAEAIKRNHSGFGLAHCLLDTMTFLAERGIQCMRTGNLDPFLHSSSRYQEWFEKSARVQRESKLLSNPGPHGITMSKFLADMKDVLETGEVIKRQVSTLSDHEKRLVSNILGDLHLVQANTLSKRLAQRDRKAPFAILLHGNSSVGKSALTKVLYYQYGKAFGLPIAPEFKYTRQGTEKHWTNFGSYQWCIQLDDIAFLRPGNTPDPTLLEMLSIVNNVPYTPEQAALEDKGKTPVNAELVIATTNERSLNLHAYFACPFAISRRFPFVVTVTPKPILATEGRLDAHKIMSLAPVLPGEYPDHWHFEVTRPVPGGPGTRDIPTSEPVAKFTNIYTFLAWYTAEAKKHARIQESALNSDVNMSTVELCDECFKLKSHCLCQMTCPRCHIRPMGSNVDCDACAAQVQVVASNPLYTEQPLQSSVLTDLCDGTMYLELQASYAYLRALHREGELGSEVKAWARDYVCPSCKANVSHNCVFHRRFVYGEHGLVDTHARDLELVAEYGAVYRCKLYIFRAVLQWRCLCFMRWWFEWHMGHFWRFKLGVKYLNQYETYKIMAGMLGHRVAAHINVPGIALAFLATMAVAGGMMKMVAQVMDCFGTKDVGGIQAATTEVGRAPEPEVSIKQPYYHHDPYTVAQVDVSSASRSTTDHEVLVKKIVENSACFLTTLNPQDEGVKQKTKVNAAVCITGSIYMVNNHGIQPSETFYLTAVLSEQAECLSPTLKNILVTPSMIVRRPDLDVAFIELPQIRPGKSILQYFCGKGLKGAFVGELIGRRRAGRMFRNPIANVRRVSTLVQELGLTMPVWWGAPAQPTLDGDCGALLVTTEPMPAVILGFHIFGGPKDGHQQSGAVHISKEEVEEAIASFRSKNIQSSTIEISAPGCTKVLTALDRKSPVRYQQEGTAIVYGSYTGYRVARSSKVGKTFICDAVANRGYPAKFGKPLMNWEPWYAALKDLTRPVTLMDLDILRTVTGDFIKDIHAGLDNEKLSRVMVYDDVTTVNGQAGVLYCDKMNRNTSVGAPYKCSKRSFLRPIACEEGQDFVEFTDDIMKMVDDIYHRYQNGEMAHPIYCGNTKDEPKKPGKMTRVFMGSSAAAAFVCRKYNLSGIKLIQENRFLFESGPGTVAQSAEWEEIREYLSQFPLDRVVAGDYGKFDKRMSSAIILEAFSVLASIYEKAGYTAEDMRCVWGIAYDTAFPVVDYNGDLLQFYGSNPSGHPLTVIINGLVNALYMRYCYAILSKTGNAKDFKKHVALMTYGDDNIMTVSPECDFFNHTAIKKVLADIDVEYTMAEKTAESVPFITLAKASFLKRDWRWDADVDAYMAPLEHESIEKMLTSRLMNDAISPQAHAIAVIATAVREYFHYGKKTFESRTKLLKGVVSECELERYVNDSTFPTWEELYEQFWGNSKHVTLKRWANTPPSELPLARLQTRKGPTSPAFKQVQNKLIKEWKETLPGSSVRPDDPKEFDDVPNDGCRLQADIIETTAGIESHTTQEVVQFLDEVDGLDVGYGSVTDNHSYLDQTANATLTEFLSRPVRIANFQWLESDAVNTQRTYAPWNLFFNDARIKYKLNNFAFMQCTLKIKVLINASPFYYGAMIGTYLPNPGFTPTTILNGSTPLNALIPFSQRPHMWIIPAENKADTMELPFLYQKNWLNIQSAADLTNMGSISFINYTTLQSANGAVGTGVSVQVYAWAENVKLSGPSVGLAMQSDEYGTGVVSAPASAIASGARWFEDIPIIGKFATATRMGASAVSAIASLFGWTNVPVIADTMPYKPSPFPQLSSNSIAHPVEKLTLDPKNELSVDPTILGLASKDELAIQNIVGKESYIMTANWSTGNLVDDILFSSQVLPTLQQVGGETSGYSVYMVPMSWVAHMFNNWRGDIIFRFKFIATPFHKGRVRISYDPLGYAGENIYSDAVSQTVVMTQIVDLGVESDVEMRIPYQQATAFQQVNADVTTVSFNTDAVPTFTAGSPYNNGVITLRVQTALSAPIASSTIPILVFARGGENLEFANPIDLPLLSTFPAQSADVYGAPQEIVTGKLGNPGQRGRYLMNFGEDIRSLRSLMRRQSLYMVFQPTVPLFSEHILSKFRSTKWPVMYGYDPNGFHSAAALVGVQPAPFNFVKMTPYAYLAPAFVAVRGSMQWTVNTDTVRPVSQVRVVRDVANIGAVAGFSQTAQVLRGNISSGSRFYVASTPSGGSGQAITNQYTNTGLTFQMPNFVKYRMMSTTPAKLTNMSTVDDGNQDCFLLEHSWCSTDDNGNIDSAKLWLYNGIGTDFGLHFFVNVPTFFKYGAIPPAN